MAAGTAAPPRRAGPGTPGNHARPPRWWPDVLGSAAVFSLLVVVALWVADGGARELANGWAGVTSAGRLAGLVSADLLLIQGLLMTRGPWIARTLGQGRLAP